MSTIIFLWWAGWVSSPLSPKRVVLQTTAFADSLPTQILNKYVEGGRHCQCQNINRAHVKERRRLALYVYGAVHRIRTCKPFTANDFQDRFLTARTHGIISSATFFYVIVGNIQRIVRFLLTFKNFIEQMSAERIELSTVYFKA